MDPVCEQKINFLQKYVPFLANLIELLANDSGKEGKLAQMQLLYNLLNKPDNSVKIETLEKCEEVLSRVFGNADEKSDGAQNAEETKTISALDQADDKDTSVTGTDEDDSGDKRNGLTNARDMEKQNLTGYSVIQNFPEDVASDIDLKAMSTSGQKVLECAVKKQKAADDIGENMQPTPDNQRTCLNLEYPASEKIETTENTILEISSTIKKNMSTDIGGLADNQISLVESAQSNIEEQNIVFLQIGENYKNKPESKENETDTKEAMVEKPSSSTRVNDITEAKEQSDAFLPNTEEVLPFKIISAESLATSSDVNLLEHINIEKEPEESAETTKEEKKSDPLDLPHAVKIVVAAPVEKLDQQSDDATYLSLADNKFDNDDDDDDDVLLIETRSSPICLDSDPDDDENIKQSVPVKPIPTKVVPEVAKPPQQKSKTIARKSTSNVKPPNQAFLNKKTVYHRKTKKLERAFIVKKDPKLLMETINLIDSDSDEDVAKAKKYVKEQNDDDVIIIDTASQQNRALSVKTDLVTKQCKLIPPKFHQKNSPKPPTAQSNFLNAVNLQPTPETSPSVASNKRATIPNTSNKNAASNRISSAAQPGKPELTSSDSKTANVSVPQERDELLKEWLECFLKNFASPLQVASHACFVLLQRVLKYRFFQRLKVTRLVLNMRAKNSEPGKMDLQMLLELRNIFIQNDVLSEAGRKFCRFATNEAFGKPVALTTDARTGKVTCRTRIVSSAIGPDEMKQTPERKAISSQNSQVTSIQKLHISTTSSPATPVPSSSTTLGSNSNSFKRIKKFRKLSDGSVAESNNDNDYTPYMGELILEDEIVSERKKSLRTNRTKRKEAGFTYSEDHDDEEFEALAKKIEDKKREELRLAEERELEKEREKERKVKKTVAKKTTSKRQSSVVEVEAEVPKEPVRKKLRLADAEILGTAEDDLLTPTWVEADGDDDDAEVDSLLNFADEPPSPENHVTEADNHFAEDDTDANENSDDSETYPPSLDVGTNRQLKNTSRSHHTQCKKFDFCVHCLKRVPRIVHHYVNEHRSAEVFTSRLRTRSIRRLLTTSNVGFVHLYKGNQQQYAAHCIFCDKEVKFLLPYWYEHFTMHTGEYTFKCSGCNIRKPTRSLLANHLQSGSGCPKKGTAIRLHMFDTKSNQIEAHICTICNYIQLHRKNVVRHLQTQHDIETVTSGHIIRVVLLQVSGPYRDEETIKKDESQLSLLQLSDDEDTINGSSMSDLEGSSLLMPNDFTDNDDLSFMICGMLDVQTNLSTTGSTLANEDEANSEDNK